MLRHGHAKDNKVYLQSNIPNPNIKLISLPLKATFFKGIKYGFRIGSNKEIFGKISFLEEREIFGISSFILEIKLFLTLGNKRLIMPLKHFL